MFWSLVLINPKMLTVRAYSGDNGPRRDIRSSTKEWNGTDVISLTLFCIACLLVHQLPVTILVLLTIRQ